MLTLVLLVALVTTLIHMLPDNKFVSDSEYSSMIAKYGQTIADNWRKTVLFKYGRVDLNGNRIPLIQSILQYIYYILPIYKEIPITWNNRYTKVIKYWTGFVYLGRSMTSSAFVLDEFVARVPISFQVTMLALLLTYIIAYPLGIAMAKKPGGVVDKIGNVFIVLNYAIPALVFYLFMNIVFGDPNGIFGWAKFGYYYNANNPSFWNLVPPILCMSFLAIPGVIIWLRRFMVDELNSDYVKFARSKGLSENKIMYTHVLRNAIVPLVRNIPATFIGAIVGSYFVEKIWSIPGTGSLFTDGLQALDVPVIQGLCVLYSAMSMLAFLLGDIITIFFDPRIKLQGE
ncbi:MAG: ABC transporter permease [Bacilli bacterium]|nr:ABC transporter permease [Bacilli bacterium]